MYLVWHLKSNALFARMGHMDALTSKSELEIWQKMIGSLHGFEGG